MRQRWYEWGVWFYRASIAQANGAGGAIVIDFAPLQGTTMIVMMAAGENSGTNSLQMLRSDEDNNRSGFYLDVASAATVQGAIPQSLSNSGTDALKIDSTSMETRLFRADDRFTIQQTGAGAQNDTMLVVLRALLSSASRPIVSQARSTNPGDVTIATPTVDMMR